jgi:hypothetical protein
MITDNQSLDGATSEFGRAIKVYDDGYGPLWIHRDSMGISGIVRAKTWEDAYSICEDEFFPDADETHEEMVKEYGFRREHKKVIHPLMPDGSVDYSTERFATLADYEPQGKIRAEQFVRWETIETPDPEAWSENELFQEAFGFRSNGGIYAKDLNGDRLERLTPELAKELGIVLTISEQE